MQLIFLSLAFALAAIATYVQAEDRVGQDRYRSIAESETHVAKMRLSIDARIARASVGFEKAKKEKENGQILGLVSFGARLTPMHLNKLQTACGCEILEVQRTIGETQMGWQISGEQLSNPSFMRNIESEYIAHLQYVMTEMEVELQGETTESAQSRYLRQKRTAFSNALVEVKAEGLKFNGVVIAGTPSGLEKIRTEAPVLAIEPLSGSQRGFAIPLEIYE